MRPIAYFDEDMQPITVTMQDLQKEVQDDANLTAYEEMLADAVSDFM